MMFLLNRERIVSEIVELCKMRISDALGIEASEVDASIGISDGKIVPSFSVSKSATGKSTSEITGVISSVWNKNKYELKNRLVDAGAI